MQHERHVAIAKGPFEKQVPSVQLTRVRAPAGKGGSSLAKARASAFRHPLSAVEFGVPLLPGISLRVA